jgi:endoribonuclease Dicer
MVVILFDGDDEPEDSQSVDVLDQDLNDSDIDDVSYQHGPRTSSEKRKAQNAIFKAWASKKAEEITAKEVKDAIQGADDETLSITDILAKQEYSARITNPRDYQNELFQKAKEENIIAVLDTGSGKTHIATLLLRHFIDEELERRAAEAPPKISFFLVRTFHRSSEPN